MKCEHFLSLILHFQVGIRAQKQARGEISKFTADVCVCVCVCVSPNKRVCARARAPVSVRPVRV